MQVQALDQEDPLLDLCSYRSSEIRLPTYFTLKSTLPNWPTLILCESDYSDSHFDSVDRHCEPPLALLPWDPVTPMHSRLPVSSMTAALL